MKLHWSPKSPFVRKVMVVAHELGCVEALQLQRSVAAMLKPNPAIMADNPLSKIPTLVLDDGQVLFDSAVICEYLDARFHGALFPSGDARWKALQQLALGDGLLDVLILWRNERERALPLQSLIDAFALKTEASLARLEREIEARPGAAIDIGQIAIGCALGYLDYRFDEFAWRARAPKLAAWYATLAQRPSFIATEPADG
ncbi:glutathione S-transferase family protein [Pseudoxanthomonas winnipegensis]|uniref:Glutathione S-transferase n=1 Tax=Pseudoxanthomonas winnipegensis TaxID=2480810 RepID=A0A4Q8M2F9_9GAMM|nr:glutathione S-transferase [Pseudoxanthomonas winnipegensis]TAA40806.1 glutathione S-transferase [Pseudoxanthomonas winnipegensis]